jgi:hypothetical protein
MTQSARLTRSTPADHCFVPQAAAELVHAHDVMSEQLQYLVDLASEHGVCGCSACQRYLRVRSVLLEIFAEEPSASHAPSRLARAA